MWGKGHRVARGPAGLPVSGRTLPRDSPDPARLLEVYRFEAGPGRGRGRGLRAAGWTGTTFQPEPGQPALLSGKGSEPWPQAVCIRVGPFCWTEQGENRVESKKLVYCFKVHSPGVPAPGACSGRGGSGVPRASCSAPAPPSPAGEAGSIQGAEGWSQDGGWRLVSCPFCWKYSWNRDLAYSWGGDHPRGVSSQEGCPHPICPKPPGLP